MARHCSGGRGKRRKPSNSPPAYLGNAPSEGDQRSAAAMGQQFVVGHSVNQRLIALVMERHHSVAIESTTCTRFLAQVMNLLAGADLPIYAATLCVRIARCTVLF